jgi:hypothetical protein
MGIALRGGAKYRHARPFRTKRRPGRPWPGLLWLKTSLQGGLFLDSLYRFHLLLAARSRSQLHYLGD